MTNEKINIAQKALKTPIQCTQSGEKLIKTLEKKLKFMVSWEPYPRPYTFMVPYKTIKVSQSQQIQKIYREQLN